MPFFYLGANPIAISTPPPHQLPTPARSRSRTPPQAHIPPSLGILNIDTMRSPPVALRHPPYPIPWIRPTVTPLMDVVSYMDTYGKRLALALHRIPRPQRLCPTTPSPHPLRLLWMLLRPEFGLSDFSLLTTLAGKQ